MSIKALFEVQLGKETTFGTAVAGSVRLMGAEDVHFTPIYQTAEYPDLRATLAPAMLAALEKVSGKATITGIATYEDICYLMDSMTIAVPTGAGPYVRAYVGALGTAYTPRMNTILWGTGTDTLRMTSSVLTKLQLKGVAGGPVKYTAEFLGKLVDYSTLAVLADRVVNVIMGNHFAVAVDAFGGTMGATAIPATAWDFDLTITLPLALKQYLGSVSPSAFENRRWQGQLKLGLEVNATSRAYLQAIYAATPALYQRLVQINAIDGTRVCLLQFAGYQKGGPDYVGDRDGVATYQLDLSGQYDPGTFANWFKASVTNSVAVLA